MREKRGSSSYWKDDPYAPAQTTANAMRDLKKVDSYRTGDHVYVNNVGVKKDYWRARILGLGGVDLSANLHRWIRPKPASIVLGEMVQYKFEFSEAKEEDYKIYNGKYGVKAVELVWCEVKVEGRKGKEWECAAIGQTKQEAKERAAEWIIPHLLTEKLGQQMARPKQNKGPDGRPIKVEQMEDEVNFITQPLIALSS